MEKPMKAEFCSTHKKTRLVKFCPSCRGSINSKRKIQAARENGRLGGRPRAKATKRAKAK